MTVTAADPTRATGESRETTSRKRRTRGRPRRRPELAHLSLSELRSYRKALMAEEVRISYWRRLLHGRIDLALTDVAGDRGADLVQRLCRVLADPVTTARRDSLLSVPTFSERPEDAEVAAAWSGLDLSGDERTEELLARLTELEQALSTYRHKLHERIDAATGELIARYHEDPAAALVALPVPPGRLARPSSPAQPARSTATPHR